MKIVSIVGHFDDRSIRETIGAVHYRVGHTTEANIYVYICRLPPPSLSQVSAVNRCAGVNPINRSSTFPIFIIFIITRFLQLKLFERSTDRCTIRLAAEFRCDLTLFRSMSVVANRIFNKGNKITR